MARSNLERLKEEMEAKEEMRPRKDAVIQLTSPPPLKESWFVNDENGQWVGPFSLLELSQLKWFKPDSWIRQEGGDRVTLAYENKRLRDMFKGNLKEEKISEFLCPHCRVELVQILYEGAPIWRCNYCEGMRVEEPKVIRILSRRDHGFSEEITRLARFYDPGLRKREGVKSADGVGAKFLLDCPSCQKEMGRRFYSLAHPIEIDFCNYCNYIWFGKNKLEILQYLAEQSS